MLSQAQRTAILELSAQGVSKRKIAHVLRLSRPTVRKVLRLNSTDVPEIQRAEKAEPYREQILDLMVSRKENRVPFAGRRPAASNRARCAVPLIDLP
jgi:IS30 family transposase